MEIQASMVELGAVTEVMGIRVAMEGTTVDRAIATAVAMEVAVTEVVVTSESRTPCFLMLATCTRTPL